ncbi:MAG: 2-phospho-L-lactate transferase, partial [Acidimicrobiia bacterium]
GPMIVALAGGVGSARFLSGLLDVVAPNDVVVVGNTGDDDWFHGLRVCPDLDSVTYTLAGANNPETGWGLAGETFATLGALARYGSPTWFNIGDRDFATHLFRTQRLREGAPLSQVTAEITRAWGLQLSLVPMSDDDVATIVTASTPDGPVDFALEEWFVRERCEPPVISVRYDGAADARPAPGVLDAIARADAVVIAPANPILSIAPILAVPGIRDAVAAHPRVVGVSNLIAGAAVKGPADRMLADLGIEASCVGVAEGYRDLLDAFVIDREDAARAPEVEALGVRTVVTDTLMIDRSVAASLARDTLAAVA